MITLSNNYYFQALDAYAYSHAEFMEAINYALSYDENNADTLHLMGRFYMDELHNYAQARSHFEKALESNIDHLPTYYHFIRWSIATQNFALGQRLISYAKGILGASMDSLTHSEALLLEKQGQFKSAVKKMKKAIRYSVCSTDVNYYKEELKRIEEKGRKGKKKGK